MSKKVKTKSLLNALVVENLFSDDVHKQIIDYITNVVPFYPPAVDNNDFIRYSYHNLPFFTDIHAQLKIFASKMFGEPVKPSYSFLSCYKDGGKCPLHIDRPQCRYTIDYLIRSTSKKPWSISISHPLEDSLLSQIDTQRPSTEEEQKAIISEYEWTTVDLKPNDAVLYSGTNSWHYRPTVLKGEADLVFFHFVPEDFNGGLD